MRPAEPVRWAGPLHWAEVDPDRPAWIFEPHSRDPARTAAEPTAVSYATLARWAVQGSRFLRSLGLGVGDGIAVLSPSHPWSPAVHWAAQLAGLYYTPISVQFQRAEVQHILSDCDARVLVLHGSQAEKAAGAPQPVHLDIERWPELIAGEPEVLLPDAAEGAEMLYSSGTTGRPKGVRAANPGAPLGTVSKLFERRVALHEIGRDTVYLSTAPLYHSAPLRYNNMVQRCGGTCVIMERFDAETSLRLIERHRVTHSQWVPTMFVRLLRLPEAVRRAPDLSSHRFAIHAAAPCPVTVKRQMLDWWGPILYEYYSGTEGNGQTAIGPDEWLRHPGSVGRPILGEVHIVDRDGRELPPGHEGRVFFSGGPRFEYYKDPEKTTAAYDSRGWSTLGDIGYLDHEGYLYLTDREAHMIISGGVNIYPREVEDVLVSHPAVQDAAVFGIPNEEFGEEVKAAVELVPGAPPVTEAELIAWCRERLAHLKCPRSVDFHDRLPRHQTGKLYKDVLKRAYR
ncbi:MAG TPA: AMP-binding protein [Pseudomonadales bacterium]